MGAELGDKVTGGRWTEKESDCHINHLEIKAVLFALMALCSSFYNIHIQLQCDNTTAVSYINSMGGSRSRSCNKVAKEIWLWCLDREIWISATHLPGVENVIADRLSRNFNDETEWTIKNVVFSRIDHIWGPFQCDIFASRLNNKVSRFVSWRPDPFAIHIDAFSISWVDMYFYAFPPFSMISRCLQKIEKEGAKGVIIVPDWSTQSWYSRLFSMLIDVPRILPQDRDLLTLPGLKKEHPLRKKMTLMACLLSGINSERQEFRVKYLKSLSIRGEEARRFNTQFTSEDGRISVQGTRLVQRCVRVLITLV